jgi:hypothetical protein
MGLFAESKNDMMYLKAGFFGFMGSGKTWTASVLAAGLHKYLKATKPVYFIDTEKGSAFVDSEVFRPRGVKLLTVKTRAFKDLKPAIEEAEKEASILLIDSISHPWTELCSAYLRSKKSGGKFIAISDWGILKDAWRSGYSEPFVNAKLHIIMCGRASNVFEDVQDLDASEKTGTEVFKSIIVGTKMRSESETGYEPYLLGEMDKVLISEGGKYVRRCNIVKDKWGVLDSKTFDDPTFEDFLPHIQKYATLGKEADVKMTGSDAMFSDDKSQSWWAEKKAREVVLEEVEGLLVAAYPGLSAGEKQMKAEMIRKAFGGYSWLALKDRHSEELGKGLVALRAYIFADLKAKGMVDELGNIIPQEKKEKVKA